MRLLDLFCGAGGCSRGYFDAGFDQIIGVDCHPQPHYPYRLVRADAIEHLRAADLTDVDLIHASPPCQAYSFGSLQHKRNHPDLVSIVRALLEERGVPYVIENVKGAPLHNPVILDGVMFGLSVVRKRLFETNWPLSQPILPSQRRQVGRWELSSVAGHGSNGPSDFLTWTLAMGINWMTRKELIQAIPPKYTEYIGREFIEWQTAHAST